MGLEVGADDYVTKPFSPRELALRVDSVLRRVDAPHRAPAAGRRRPRRRRGRARGVPRRRAARAHRPRVRPAALPAGPPGDGVLARRAARAGVGVVVRRPVDGDGARAPAAREDRARPHPAGPAADGVGRRLPMGGRDVTQRRAPDPAGGQLVCGRRRPRRPGPGVGDPPPVDLLAARAGRGGGHRLGAGRRRRDRAADVHLVARPRGGDARERGVRRGRPARGRRRRRRHLAVVGSAARGRPPARTRTGRSSARAADRASCRRSRPSWSAPAVGWRSRGSARRGSRAPGASWSRGSPTTCARRWPACGRWPRPSRTGWSRTRRATTGRSAPRSTGWCGWSTTCSSCRGSTRAC